MKIKIKRLHFGAAVMIDGTTQMSAETGRNCEAIEYDTETMIHSITGRLPSVPKTHVHSTNIQMFYIDESVEREVKEAPKALKK